MTNEAVQMTVLNANAVHGNAPDHGEEAETDGMIKPEDPLA